jgi:Zn-dependent peptidase ImmA (M78 family)
MRRFYTPERIWYDADIYLTLDNDKARGLASWALSFTPSEVIEFALENLLILVEEREGGGTYIPNAVVGKRDIILLSEALFDQPREKQRDVLLHEIAHAWLKHPFPMIEDVSEGQYDENEKEAWALVKEWLSKDTNFRRKNDD